jgi:hypothetical protein
LIDNRHDPDSNGSEKGTGYDAIGLAISVFPRNALILTKIKNSGHDQDWFVHPCHFRQGDRENQAGNCQADATRIE